MGQIGRIIASITLNVGALLMRAEYIKPVLPLKLCLRPLDVRMAWIISSSERLPPWALVLVVEQTIPASAWDGSNIKRLRCALRIRSRRGTSRRLLYLRQEPTELQATNFVASARTSRPTLLYSDGRKKTPPLQELHEEKDTSSGCLPFDLDNVGGLHGDFLAAFACAVPTPHRIDNGMQSGG